MASKAMTSTSDSPNQADPAPRKQRLFTLTPLGHRAVAWIKQQDTKTDQFAFFCEGCLRPVSVCSCPMKDPS
jgi:hypothetical protein